MSLIIPSSMTSVSNNGKVCPRASEYVGFGASVGAEVAVGEGVGGGVGAGVGAEVAVGEGVGGGVGAGVGAEVAVGEGVGGGVGASVGAEVAVGKGVGGGVGASVGAEVAVGKGVGGGVGVDWAVEGVLGLSAVSDGLSKVQANVRMRADSRVRTARPNRMLNGAPLRLGFGSCHTAVPNRPTKGAQGRTLATIDRMGWGESPRGVTRGSVAQSGDFCLIRGRG